MVDNFGIKYVEKEHADLLIAAIEENYEFSTDWCGTLYCGITINWDYAKRTINLSMPNYISFMLHKYQHPPPKRTWHSPHLWNRPMYGATQQLTKAPDTTDPLKLSEVKRIKKIVGTLLYYARAVDATMLVALGTITSQQAIETQTTSKCVNHLLYYYHTHPDAKLRYHASDMILYIHSDAYYNSEAKARSRAVGNFYLGNTASVCPTMYNNGAILNTSNIMRNVVASASEAECGAIFNNTKEALSLCTTIHKMGNPQPPSPLEVNNSTAVGFANKKLSNRSPSPWT